MEILNLTATSLCVASILSLCTVTLNVITVIAPVALSIALVSGLIALLTIE